jgi:hypothetical protein
VERDGLRHPDKEHEKGILLLSEDATLHLILSFLLGSQSPDVKAA